MEALNFGEDMIAWMRLFLTERIAHLLMGGHLTLKILLEQGVPQWGYNLTFCLHNSSGNPPDQDHQEQAHKGD